MIVGGRVEKAAGCLERRLATTSLTKLPDSVVEIFHFQVSPLVHYVIIKNRNQNNSNTVKIPIMR